MRRSVTCLSLWFSLHRGSPVGQEIQRRAACSKKVGIAITIFLPSFSPPFELLSVSVSRSSSGFFFFFSFFFTFSFFCSCSTSSCSSCFQKRKKKFLMNSFLFWFVSDTQCAISPSSFKFTRRRHRVSKARVYFVILSSFVMCQWTQFLNSVPYSARVLVSLLK